MWQRALHDEGRCFDSLSTNGLGSGAVRTNYDLHTHADTTAVLPRRREPRAPSAAVRNPRLPPAREHDASVSDAGFTLIELLISLLLFALIAVAGIALVDSVLGVQGRTATRLDRLTDLQRAMLVVSGDVEQVAGGDIAGGGPAISFRRAAPGVGGPPVTVRYALDRGVLVRDAGGGAQAVLRDVAAVRWRFFDGGWIDRWPTTEEKAWPRGIELEVTLGGAPGGAIRRVMLLPGRAKDVT